MTDDLEPLRRSRPDRLLPDDPPDPEVLAREKARLMAAITEPDGAARGSAARGSAASARSSAASASAGERGAGERGAAVHRRTPSIYPRLAYRDEVAALEFLTR